MSLITIDTDASMDAHGAQYVYSVGPFVAGEALLAASPCRMDSDGKVYMSISTETTVSGVSDYLGFAPKAVASGCPVTLYGQGARFDYGSSLTPNTHLYIGATKGRLDTAMVADADYPVALVVSDTDIVVIK
jgi:hypothetical protein